jgi:uncharacterized protein with FMN-binding domain
MKKYLLSAVVIFGFLFYSTVAVKSDSSPTTATSLNLPTNPVLPTNLPPTGQPTATSPPKRNTPSATTAPTSVPVGQYKNGTFTGGVADAFYGNIQVAAVITGGKLTNVSILQYPNDRNRSIAINSQALPILQSEAVQAQSAAVDMVSGATDTSGAFIQSLSSALSQAAN